MFVVFPKDVLISLSWRIAQRKAGALVKLFGQYEQGYVGARNKCASAPKKAAFFPIFFLQSTIEHIYKTKINLRSQNILWKSNTILLFSCNLSHAAVCCLLKVEKNRKFCNFFSKPSIQRVFNVL